MKATDWLVSATKWRQVDVDDISPEDSHRRCLLTIATWRLERGLASCDHIRTSQRSDAHQPAQRWLVVLRYSSRCGVNLTESPGKTTFSQDRLLRFLQLG